MESNLRHFPNNSQVEIKTRKLGRPVRTVIDPKRVEELARSGMTAKKIADEIGVPYQTFMNMKGRNDLLRFAFTRGRSDQQGSLKSKRERVLNLVVEVAGIRFDEIVSSSNFSEDFVSNALAYWILIMRTIKPVRDEVSGHFRYYIRDGVGVRIDKAA